MKYTELTIHEKINFRASIKDFATKWVDTNIVWRYVKTAIETEIYCNPNFYKKYQKSRM